MLTILRSRLHEVAIGFIFVVTLHGCANGDGAPTGSSAGNTGTAGTQDSSGASGAGAAGTGGTAASGGAGRSSAGSGGSSVEPALDAGDIGQEASALGDATAGGSATSEDAATVVPTDASATSGDSPGLRFVGRTAPGTPPSAVRFSWPGVHLHARFNGTQVSLNLNDGSNKNRFTVIVDNTAAKTVTTSPGQTSLTLAMGLPTGVHQLLVWRNTEAGMGVTQFSGLANFGEGGALLAPPAAPDRRIEVIGDSLSVGAGDEGNTACPGGIDAFTNNYLAYGPVAARAVGADVVTIAWSGIGVYRNYDGSTSNTMPARYPYAVPNDASAWDFARYQPHVVVMNLGTNDFGQGDPGTAYETAYVSFVKTVRGKYPGASFILIDMYGGNRLTRINNVIAALKGGGESKVEALSFSSVQNNLGCNQHPNVAAQTAMGNVLATRLKSLMNWP